MEFYELMVNAFNEVGWSQNYVSKEFNINRGILHRFYRGTGSIFRDDFREIIYKIPLSISEKKLLTERFYKESKGYKYKKCIERNCQRAKRCNSAL